ncbi:MAG: hypothetical protein WCP01_11510 [Methylococcaceae bacterium]
MTLIDLFKNYMAKQIETANGNPSNPDDLARVTATGHATQGSNHGNPSNPENNTHRELINICEQIETETNRNLVVKCGNCLHFKSFNKHGRGSGLCEVGASFHGLWASSIRECEAFVKQGVEMPDHKPNALLVACFTPSGKVIEVEATSPEHAAWLQRMNPKRVTP